MWKVILIVGVFLILAGTVFSLQGLGVVGPSSSFMFTNPAWILNGLIISVLGLVIASASLVIRAKKRS